MSATATALSPVFDGTRKASERRWDHCCLAFTTMTARFSTLVFGEASQIRRVVSLSNFSKPIVETRLSTIHGDVGPSTKAPTACPEARAAGAAIKIYRG